MASAYEDLMRIVDAGTTPEQRVVAMRGFAEQLHWTPSYEVQGSFGVDVISSHLVVEHGLDNSATISFLRAPYRAGELDAAQLRALLAVSYNNLVEWHLFVSQSDVRRINNLADPSRGSDADRIDLLTRSDFERHLSATDLDRLFSTDGFRRSRRACDEALLQVVSRWKRMLKADYAEVENQNLSALFNALIFVRGCEDRDLDRPSGSTRVLLRALSEQVGETLNVSILLADALKRTGVESELSEFVSTEALQPFRSIDRTTAVNLFRDLYAPRDAAYDFNFALMSKHALSRIYEKYVALLRADEDGNGSKRQMSFVATVPSESIPLKAGAVYTPQFIAGFFARYIRDNVTPRRLRSLRTIDPACGSGIFLRTLLELQCDPIVQGTTPSSIRQAFSQTFGIDNDPNACEATRLSLALLYLVAIGQLPKSLELHVMNEDAIRAALDSRLNPGSFGAVITNPPYRKLDHLSADERETYRQYLGGKDVGRVDAYVPFVKLCLELAEVDGFVCLVLPQVFLTASNAGPLRKAIADEFDVRCLVDLSAVPVFEGVGAYSILLVLQRRALGARGGDARAHIAQISEFAGAALQACLDGRTVETPYYSVYPVTQHYFHSKQWILVSPAQMRVDDRLRELPRLSSFLEVTQGFVTGADDVFIMDKNAIHKAEGGIYVDYLPDRQILRYRLPQELEQAVFYPYENGELLNEDALATRYPQTWAHLKQHRRKLSARKSVLAGTVPWWRPERPREPSVLLRPKIVCPHLMLTPRFAVDEKGSRAVSHSPFMIANEDDRGEESTLLSFLCAVLNSSVCNWHLRTYAPKYGRGYNRLEVTLLKAVPVPDFARISASALSTIVDCVRRLSRPRVEKHLDDEIDAMVAELYGFTAKERREILRIG